MTSLRRALILGVLVWFVPFLVAFLIFPLRESSRPLFESIMPVALAAIVAVLAGWYFGRDTQASLREGLLLGVLWLGISVVIDAPLMLLGGPMQMTIGEYLGDIGVTYLMIPVITSGMAAALARASKVAPRTLDAA
jgi:hypothetical protein